MLLCPDHLASLVMLPCPDNIVLLVMVYILITDLLRSCTMKNHVNYYTRKPSITRDVTTPESHGLACVVTVSESTGLTLLLLHLDIWLDLRFSTFGSLGLNHIVTTS